MDLRDFNFARDEKGRFVVLEGWYQDSDGLLFHYDGVVWDQIPDEVVTRLEYLG